MSNSSVRPFRWVRETTSLLAAAQRDVGLARTVNPSAAMAIAAAAVASGGRLATSLAARSAGFLIGVIWPLVAMVFVGYVQREFNRAIQ